MTTMADLGVTVQTSRVTETITIAGMSSIKEFAVFVCALPSPPKIHASFSPEGVLDKVVKIFKKEIQVGDKTFDDAVYVSTDTPAETAAFLQSQSIQNTILMCVMGGGSIEVTQNQVIARIPSSTTDEDPSLVSFVQTVLGR
jgi:hypothetical protein